MMQIKDLTFGYGSKPPIFNNLSLQLSPGHIYGLLGKNGAGKSTLLKNMIGLARAKSGQCQVNGVNVTGRPVSVLQDVYFLPEEIFVPNLTAAQFVSATAGFYPKFSLDDFNKYLDLLEIDRSGIMEKFSFGQQKKAMIAFGLATNTGSLIMDEPTNGLDIPSKVQFRKLIASALLPERCMVISTHQVRDLDSLIDTLLILHNREIVVNKNLEEISTLLTFGTFESVEGLPVLYQEESMRGISAILKNITGKYGKTDLEILFNAIISDNKSLTDILKTTRYEQSI